MISIGKYRCTVLSVSVSNFQRFKVSPGDRIVNFYDVVA